MFVLKTYWDDEPAYYVNINNAIPSGMTFVHLTTDVASATLFKTPEEAENVCSTIDSNIFKIYPICPKCGKDYYGYPALSRKDNKTKICSACGTIEALTAFQNKKKTNC